MSTRHWDRGLPHERWYQSDSGLSSSASRGPLGLGPRDFPTPDFRRWRLDHPLQTHSKCSPSPNRKIDMVTSDCWLTKGTKQGLCSCYINRAQTWTRTRTRTRTITAPQPDHNCTSTGPASIGTFGLQKHDHWTKFPCERNEWTVWIVFFWCTEAAK